MAHIALIITGLTGKLNASFEMVSRLHVEGHQVTYLSPIDVRKRVEEQGFDYVQLPEINFNFSDPLYGSVRSLGWVKRFLFHFRNLSKHYSEGKKILKLNEYKRILGDLHPDKVVVDMELHELILTALDLKIPVTLFSSWFSNRAQPSLPPLRTPIIPGIGFSGSKMGILNAWAKVKLRTCARLLVNMITFRNYRRTALKKYAKEIGFSTKNLANSNFPPLFTYTNLPILTITMPELEFPHKPHTNLTYVGAMVYDRRDEVAAHSAVMEELSKIFINAKSGKKLIYCSMGSFKEGDVTFLRKLIKAVEKQLEWILLISLGSLIESKDLEPLPENVFLFDWLPQLKVLEQADCSINHGGTHTIYECIHFSVPMLIYSGKRFDQNGTAARIAYHGLGIMADKDVDNSAKIEENISEILTDPLYGLKVAAIHAKYEAYKKLKISSFLQI